MVGAIVVGVAAATFFTIRAGMDQPTKRSATTTTTGGSSASGAAAELLGLLGRSAALDYEVRYNVTQPPGPPSVAGLWRRPPLAREDTESGSGDGLRRTSEMVTTSGPVACTQSGSGQWACSPKPGLTLGDLGAVPPALANQLRAFRVVGRDDRVAGQSVRCFTVSQGSAASAEICLTPDGIVARAVLGSTRLELVGLNRSRPPDSIFQPPAPVGG